MNEENSSNFEAVQNEKSNKKGINKLLFLIIAIIIVLAGLIAYYSLKVNKPRYIFDKKIDQCFSSSNTEIADINMMKMNSNFEISVNGEDEDIKKLNEYLNDAKISISTEVDKESKQEIVGIKLSKSQDDLIDAKLKIDINDKKIYVDLGEFYDKVISMDISDLSAESSESAVDRFETISQKVNQKKAQSILKSEIKAELVDEYFSTESIKVENEDLTKDTLKLSEKQLIKFIENICTNLKENKEFLDCFEDSQKIEETLDDLINQIKDEETDEDVYIIISVYSKGIMKNIEKVDLSVQDNEDNNVTLEIKKENDEYGYKIIADKEQVIEGKLKVEYTDKDYVFNIFAKTEDVEITLKTSGNVAYGEKLSDFNTENAVDINNLSSEDFYAILEKFSKSKLYTIIEEISDSTSSVIDDIEDETDSLIIDDEKEETKEIKEDEEKTDIEDNVIKTYDDEKIKFSIPEGFKIYSSDSEYYKLFQKEIENGNITISVSAEYSSLNEYLDEIKEDAEYFESQKNYKNVKVSDVKDITIKGNTFKRIDMSYEYSIDEEDEDTIQYNDAYIVYEIDEDNLYVVEIEGTDLIKDEEINEFLSIEK